MQTTRQTSASGTVPNFSSKAFAWLQAGYLGPRKPRQYTSTCMQHLCTIQQSHVVQLMHEVRYMPMAPFRGHVQLLLRLKSGPFARPSRVLVQKQATDVSAGCMELMTKPACQMQYGEIELCIQVSLCSRLLLGMETVSSSGLFL